MAKATPLNLGFLQREHRTDEDGGAVISDQQPTSYSLEGGDEQRGGELSFFDGGSPSSSELLRPGVRPQDSFVLHKQNPDKSYHFAYVAPGQAHQQQKQGDVVTGESPRHF